MNTIGDKYKNLRILLVDDHMLMRNVIMQSLRSLGFQNIDTAPGGKEAMDLIRERAAAGKPFHLAFLDWHMPGMDGMSVLKSCRSDKTYSNMAIVMLTAEQEKKNVLLAIDAGATSYIVKPVSQDSLEKNMENILRWLEKKGIADMGSGAPSEAAKAESDAAPAKLLPEDIQAELRPVISRSVQKIFSNIFNVEIVPQDYNGRDLDNSLMCIGRLHQEGVTINLRFFFDQQLLKPLLMQLYSPQFLASQEVYSDAACEIVNILASQVKAFLNGHGYKLILDLPQMCDKPDLRQSEPVIDVRFSLNKDSCFLVDLTAATA